MTSRMAVKQTEQLTTRIAPTDLADLVSLFVECVDGGASMGYLAPLPVQESAGYWRTIVAELSGGSRILIVAREAGRSS